MNPAVERSGVRNAAGGLARRAEQPSTAAGAGGVSGPSGVWADRPIFVVRSGCGYDQRVAGRVGAGRSVRPV